MTSYKQAQGYKGSNNENGAEDVILEGEECQAHVREDEVLCQEVQHFKQLQQQRNIPHMKQSAPYNHSCSTKQLKQH